MNAPSSGDQSLDHPLQRPGRDRPGPPFLTPALDTHHNHNQPASSRWCPPPPSTTPAPTCWAPRPGHRPARPGRPCPLTRYPTWGACDPITGQVISTSTSPPNPRSSRPSTGTEFTQAQTGILVEPVIGADLFDRQVQDRAHQHTHSLPRRWTSGAVDKGVGADSSTGQQAGVRPAGRLGSLGSSPPPAKNERTEMAPRLLYTGPNLKDLHEQVAKAGRIDTQAPVHARAQHHIHATPTQVWQVLSDLTAWPHTIQAVRSVTLQDEAVAVDHSFTWNNAGTRITSTFAVIDPHRELTWTGRAAGTRAIQERRALWRASTIRCC